MFKKRRAISREHIRSELEMELEEARSSRAQLRSIENPTGMTSSLTLMNSIHSPVEEVINLR